MKEQHNPDLVKRNKMTKLRKVLATKENSRKD